MPFAMSSLRACCQVFSSDCGNRYLLSLEPVFSTTNVESPPSLFFSVANLNCFRGPKGGVTNGWRHRYPVDTVAQEHKTHPCECATA